MENKFRNCHEIFSLMNVDENKSEFAFKEMLEKAFKEAHSEPTGDGLASVVEKIKLFYAVIFSLGDITDRNHNIFNGVEVDGGGKSYRSLFKIALDFVKKKDPNSYAIILEKDLIRQYTCLDNIIDNRVITMKNTNVVSKVVQRFEKSEIDVIAKYIANIIKTATDVELCTISKFIKLPKTSSKKKTDKNGTVLGRRDRMPVTKKVMKLKHDFLLALSKEMDWEVFEKPGYTDFKGFKKWKQKYNQEHESFLFSSKKILSFSKEEFFDWLNKIPSGMRFRTKTKLYKSQKWGNLRNWYDEWEENKKAFKQRERELISKKSSGLTEDEEKELSKISKLAKVNSGANNLSSLIKMYSEYRSNSNESELIAEEVFKKSKFNIPVLPVIDISGSMSGFYIEIGSFLLTTILLKNFHNGIEPYAITFNNRAEFKKFNINKEKSFIDNLRSNKLRTSSSTHISSIYNLFESAEKNSYLSNFINSYETLLIITDSDFNNEHNARESVSSIISKLKEKFDWNGTFVIWSIKPETHSKFIGLSNVVFVSGTEISVVNSIFNNIKDLKEIDYYVPLLSLYNSKRYAPVINSL